MRLKASSWAVRTEARPAAFRISRNVIGDRAFHPQLVEKEVAVAEDGGEEIVEVVRHAAGELAERLHLLRANELVLKLFSRGHIHERADEANGACRCRRGRCGARSSRSRYEPSR